MTYTTLIVLFIGFVIGHALILPFTSPQTRSIEKAVTALWWESTALIAVAVSMWLSYVLK